MLSQSAFNALLKIMEEPPEHAIFILATTEAHKVPLTIMSRCQRYDFKKIPIEKIKESLEKITKAERIKIDTETLYLIARESEGSMRDSLSLLDQLTVSFEDKITHKDVISLLGIPDNESLKSILRAVFAKEPAECVELVRNAAVKGNKPEEDGPGHNLHVQKPPLPEDLRQGLSFLISPRMKKMNFQPPW